MHLSFVKKFIFLSTAIAADLTVIVSRVFEPGFYILGGIIVSLQHYSAVTLIIYVLYSCTITWVSSTTKVNCRTYLSVWSEKAFLFPDCLLHCCHSYPTTIISRVLWNIFAPFLTPKLFIHWKTLHKDNLIQNAVLNNLIKSQYKLAPPRPDYCWTCWITKPLKERKNFTDCRTPANHSERHHPLGSGVTGLQKLLQEHNNLSRRWTTSKNCRPTSHS